MVNLPQLLNHRVPSSRRFIGISLATLSLCTNGVAWSRGENQSFDDFKSERTEQYEEYSEQQESKFREYRKKINEAFSEYKAKAEQVWGDDKAVMPDQHRWVEYQRRMSEKRVVDFSRGTGEIAVAVDSEDMNWSDVRQRLADALTETITQAPDARSITDIADNPDAKQRQGDPLLDGQVKNDDGVAVGEENAREFAEKRVRRAEVKKETVKGKDGKKRVAVKVSFDLLPTHMRKRAQRYKDLVLERAENRGIKPELVFALIETESSYNPKAQSPIPAFGLMQLVPSTGALDAYRFVHNEDKLVTDTYLYDPENNVELGVGYMDKIFQIYFDGVKDELSRQWCAVAAYNTGVGNVIRTFVGRFSESGFESRSAWREKAFRRINNRKPDEVFDYMKANLPAEETQNYIVKIRKRMSKYDSF